MPYFSYSACSITTLDHIDQLLSNRGDSLPRLQMCCIPGCKLGFASEEQLRGHLEAVHRRYKCVYCNCLFETDAQRAVHAANKHG